MCRPAHEGGRRCPGNRGERRRAYQRSRYAAAQSEKEREASTNQATDEDQSPQEQEEQSEQVEERTTPPPRHRDDVAAMTPEQRAEVLEELREEIAVTRQQVQEQIKQLIISDTKRTQEMFIEALEHRGEDTSKFVMNPETVGYFSYSLWNPSVDPSLISEYESKVRELGAAVESATLITEYETYEEYGLNSSEMTAEDIKRLVHDYGLMGIHLKRHETYTRNTTERDIYQDPIFTNGNITPESFSKYVAKLAYLDEYRTAAIIERMVPRFLEEHPEVEDAYNSPKFHREVIEYIGKQYTMKDEDYLALFLSQGHIEQAQNKIYADAFRQESGQEFSSVITPEKTSISAQPDIIDQFNDACRLYPDTLTENAQKYNNDVHFSLKRGFARGDSYVSKRAYYRRSEDVKVPIKGKATYVMTMYGLQAAGNYTISEMDKKLEKGVWDEEMYRGSLDNNYPEVTEENLARAKEFVDKQNAPAGKHETGRYYVTNRRGGFMKVAYTTFTDKYGTERLMITSKNDVTLGHEKKSMTSIVTDGMEDTTIHEVAHFMEADPQINMACRKFLERRTEGLESMIYHKADHTNDHQDEIVVEDGFYNSYVGKSYRYSHNTEVFSMGMEGLFSPDEYPSSDRPHGGLKPIPVISISRKGKDAGSIGIEQVVSHPQVDDPEHRALILGLLSSVQSREELYRQVEREV